VVAGDALKRQVVKRNLVMSRTAVNTWWELAGSNKKTELDLEVDLAHFSTVPKYLVDTSHSVKAIQ
jgi:hypothetical protein